MKRLGDRRFMNERTEIDRDLVNRTLSGDDEAFEDLFCEYRDRLFRTAFYMLKDHAKAQDAVQDAFVKAYKTIATCRDGGAFSAWIRRITVNRCLDLLRTRTRHKEVALPAEEILPHGKSVSPESVLEFDEFSSALNDALSTLGDEHRTTFVLHAMEGMKHKEIAKAMKCKEGTVMSRLFHARKKLQELLVPYLNEGGEK